MKSIEFFGVSNSGKTFYKNKIKYFFTRKNFYDYRSIILNFSKSKINLSFFDIITLFYFKIIKTQYIKKIIFKNKIKIKLKVPENDKKKNNNNKYYKINFFYLNYQNICKRLFKKLKNKNINFCDFTFDLIDNLKCNQEFKNLLKFWFTEEYCAYYLSKNYKNKILLDSEGFIQRLSVYLYFSSKSDHFKIINRYLSLCPLPDQILITKFQKNKSIIKKLNLPEKIKIKKEKMMFSKIKKIIYNQVKSKKIKVNLYEINNKINYHKIAL